MIAAGFCTRFSRSKFGRNSVENSVEIRSRFGRDSVEIRHSYFSDEFRPNFDRISTDSRPNFDIVGNSNVVHGWQLRPNSDQTPTKLRPNSDKAPTFDDQTPTKLRQSSDIWEQMSELCRSFAVTFHANVGVKTHTKTCGNPGTGTLPGWQTPRIRVPVFFGFFLAMPDQCPR